ncbi:hypothetical protein ACFCX0_08190 [Streptomyces sp. NPDC056352]|uniref:hypothetical protein n=1 Tax=Streptomyces sp. NPDC056352 TaxID=3345791 RepID=UPI0035DFBE06
MPKSQQVHGPRIEHLIGRAPDEAWQRLSCGDGARLPAVWEFDGDEPTRQRWLLARPSITKPDELTYFLASAPWTPPSPILCFQSAKNECGLDQ